jgi:epoxyqueuosine reductase QueG
MMFEQELKNILKRNGATLVGFSDLGEKASPEFPHLRYAVTIVRRLSDTVVETINGKPTIMYFHHYRTTNTKLDLLALDAVDFIESQGYSALPIAASQSTNTDKDAYRGVFSHKTAAVLSGLGFIGKNALFITPEYGSKIRLATVLTDMPLSPEFPVMTGGCGSCEICKNACPAKAITGNNYVYGEARDTILDARRCSEHMKTYKDIGRGAVCGICMRVCPYNQRKGGTSS